MSKTTLKKTLKGMDADQLREVIVELYENRPEAKNYLEYWIDPNPDKVIEEYKKSIFKIFFMSEGRPRKSPDFTELKKLLKYFFTLYLSDEQNIDLKLYSTEIYLLWLQSRNKVMSHEKRATAMCNELSEDIDSYNMTELFGLRYERLNSDFKELFERGDLKSRRGWRRWYR